MHIHVVNWVCPVCGKLTEGDIFTFSWAKAAIQDVVTLHGEVEHERKAKDGWRDRAIIAEHQLAALKDAVQAAALP